VQTNGDDVYPVFGADTSNTTLETWVEEHKNQTQTSSQESSSQVIQYQNVSQLNVNQQGVAVAIAVGEGSVAKAWQVSCQFNKNKQVADATAINIDPKSVQTVTASADLKGDFSKSDVKRTSDGSAHANEQNASANITQY
jgi:hypothetical protein